MSSSIFAELCLVAEQFSLRPDAYARWLFGDELPPNITRMDWHAFNVAAAAFLAEAHKRAQDDAERKAKRKSSNTRGPRSRLPATRVDDAPSDPLASATYTTLMLPDTAFS